MEWKWFTYIKNNFKMYSFEPGKRIRTRRFLFGYLPSLKSLKLHEDEKQQHTI